MTEVFTLNSGKDVEEIAAIQIPLHNLFCLGAKEAYILSKQSSVT
jgi:hypothetical protein